MARPDLNFSLVFSETGAIFQPFGGLVHLPPNRPSAQGLADGQHLFQPLEGQPVRGYTGFQLG
ncbi:MAG: hypothetical protein JOY92_16010 [Verrucomicrobia bacterium]|nr:hypothetical protein [Verrucomicrobiota bacterium]